MSLVTKVRLPKLRLPEATPKEHEAWASFVALATEQSSGDGGPMPAIVSAELERLCSRGNPIALRFRERLSIAQFQPRKVDEAPAPPPVKRRISMVKWGNPGKKST